MGGMRWPRSTTVQTIISVVLGLVAGIGEYTNLAMQSFNNFYFGPHKAYPYPYSTVHSANVAWAERCGLAFGLVFFVAIALQTIIVRRKVA